MSEDMQSKKSLRRKGIAHNYPFSIFLEYLQSKKRFKKCNYFFIELINNKIITRITRYSTFVIPFLKLTLQFSSNAVYHCIYSSPIFKIGNTIIFKNKAISSKKALDKIIFLCPKKIQN